MKSSYKHSDITDKIIKAFYTVYNKLGFGFLEKVYERALMIELTKMNLTSASQVPAKVYYEKQEVGVYFADLLVQDVIIVELKACESLREEHEAQLLNYLKATQIEVGLLLNFGVTPSCRRRVFSNQFKTNL